MPSSPPARVLIASQPVAEGVPQAVLDLIAGIESQGYDLDVACPPGSTLWDGLVGRKDVSLHAISGSREPGLRDLGVLWALLPLVRRADVVHVHSAKAGFVGRLAARLQRRTRRCVFTPHAWSFWAAGGLRARVYLALERRAARWCHTIIVVSEHERAEGLAAGVGRPQQYRVVPNGVDLERFAAERRPRPGRIVFVGRLSPQKRPDVAIDAFRTVREEHSEAELLLVGQGPWLERLQGRVRELGLDGVGFLGFREDIPQLLAGAACFVLTSDYEGCPISLIEAMAAGVPVVATAVGGVPELLEDGRTGLLVEPGDHAAVAAAVSSLLADPTRAEALGAAGREHARRHLSRDRMAEQVIAVYEEIVGA